MLFAIISLLQAKKTKGATIANEWIIGALQLWGGRVMKDPSMDPTASPHFFFFPKPDYVVAVLERWLVENSS